jgi:ribosomal protein L37AE/L43A
MGLYDNPLLDDDPDGTNPLPARVRKLTGFELLAEQQRMRPLICRRCGASIVRIRRETPKGYVCDSCAKEIRQRDRRRQTAVAKARRTIRGA